MTVVAAAIIGSAVVGGVVSTVSGRRAADASERGAANAADATVQSTTMQIEEIQRQFDYQSQILLPQIQQQYNAQRAYSDLLGIGGPEIGANADTGFMPTARDDATQQQRRDEEIALYQDYMQQYEPGSAEYQSYADAISQVTDRPTDQQAIDASNLARGAQMGGPGSSGVGRGPGDFRDSTGAFIDPNLDQTRLADSSAYADQVANNQYAGDTYGEDQMSNYLANNRIAAGSVDQDLMVNRTNDVRLAEGAAGTGVYGDQFEASPGYAFQREEMQRQLDRQGSAGGPNIGGRAIMEAQRRAQGLAAGDYYNWAQGRTSDLTRQAGAEATDISRGDQAYAGYENQRITDVQRDDVGFQDYLRREGIDISRGDAAASQNDQLRASDQSRMDQAYYNYLNALQTQAGFGGGPAAQAVNASQAAGAGVSGAYGSQGRQLSNIYSDEGTSQANIAYAQGVGINNAIQGGVSNYITAGTGGAQIPGFRT
jgi:hypothetical protein